MKRLLRTLALIASFTVQIQVRAADVFKADHGVRHVEMGPSRLHLAPETLLEKRNGNAVHLVRGEVLIEFKNDLRLQTPYVYCRCAEDSCTALVTRRQDRVTLRALAGALTVHRLGENKDYLLPPAMQVKVRAVAADGLAEMEFPQSLPWNETVTAWARLFPGNVKQFKSTLAEFREIWHESVEAVSHLHEEQAGRVIASYEKGLAEQEARRRAQERDDEEMRKLFRQKNYLSP